MNEIPAKVQNELDALRMREELKEIRRVTVALREVVVTGNVRRLTPSTTTTPLESLPFLSGGSFK